MNIWHHILVLFSFLVLFSTYMVSETAENALIAPTASVAVSPDFPHYLYANSSDKSAKNLSAPVPIKIQPLTEKPPLNKSLIFNLLMNTSAEKCLKPLIHYPDRHLCCYKGPDNIDKYLSEDCLYKYNINSTHIMCCFVEDIIPFKTITETKNYGNTTTITRYVDLTKQVISKNTYPLITIETAKTTTTNKPVSSTIAPIPETVKSNEEIHSYLLPVFIMIAIIIIILLAWHLGKEQ